MAEELLRHSEEHDRWLLEKACHEANAPGEVEDPAPCMTAPLGSSRQAASNRLSRRRSAVQETMLEISLRGQTHEHQCHIYSVFLLPGTHLSVLDWCSRGSSLREIGEESSVCSLLSSPVFLIAGNNENPLNIQSLGLCFPSPS